MRRRNFLKNRFWSYRAAPAADPFEHCGVPRTHCRRISGLTQLRLQVGYTSWNYSWSPACQPEYQQTFRVTQYTSIFGKNICHLVARQKGKVCAFPASECFSKVYAWDWIWRSQTTIQFLLQELTCGLNYSAWWVSKGVSFLCDIHTIHTYICATAN